MHRFAVSEHKKSLVFSEKRKFSIKMSSFEVFVSELFQEKTRYNVQPRKTNSWRVKEVIIKAEFFNHLCFLFLPIKNFSDKFVNLQYC